MTLNLNCNFITHKFYLFIVIVTLNLTITKSLLINVDLFIVIVTLNLTIKTFFISCNCDFKSHNCNFITHKLDLFIVIVTLNLIVATFYFL